LELTVSRACCPVRVSASHALAAESSAASIVPASISREVSDGLCTEAQPELKEYM
jgi:hypothetical protein